ncbi:unannotated protein [freshwater metagenome]|uniref:Unannotated protein n=1 Tax=freshwater metagenome TaxID=449393 RepID=A0A6J7FIB0_9ZZZZ
MIKVYALLPKRPDITAEAFHEHWATTHREHALRITRLRRYVQAHRLEQDVPGLRTAPYEGIPEVWYDSLESAVGQDDDPDYTEHAQKDEPSFVDMAGIAWVMTDEALLRDDLLLEQDTPVHKLLLLAVRPAGQDPAAFAAAWRAAAEDVVATTGVRRAAVATVLPDAYASGDPAYDGVLELWWPDEAAHADAWAAHGEDVVARLTAVADAERLRAAAVHELRVIWPGPARDAVAAPAAPNFTTHDERLEGN